MRISGSDAIIVLAKEIWYCIDSLTNRNLQRSVIVYFVGRVVGNVVPFKLDR